MKARPSQSDFAALIGIDWADKKHDICEIAANSDTPLYKVIKASPKSVIEWAQELRAKYPGEKVAVACELKKGPLEYALEKFEHIVLSPELINGRELPQNLYF